MLWIKRRSVGVVAVNLRPRRGAWGGANQWAAQVVRMFEYQGWAVRFDLSESVDAVVMTHTGMSADTTFGADEVEALKARRPGVRCVHRINDNDIRKETTGMDEWLARSNRVADHTVFVSGWLRDHHAAGWFDAGRPHSVIVPGADPRYFHAVGRSAWRPGMRLRLVTHHWSDNWRKGFDVYQDIDRLVAESHAGRFELWVIGRWPRDLEWKAARTLPPASGEALTALLRECHGYVSASRFEPGAMHVAEGLQCGLPLLYHRDSGGTVEQGRKYGMEIGDDLGATLEAFATGYEEMRGKVLSDPPSGSKMALSYVSLVEKLVADA